MEEKQQEFKLEMNAIVKGGEKPEDRKNAINNVKTLYESRIKITKFFDDYSKILSETKYINIVYWITKGKR